MTAAQIERALERTGLAKYVELHFEIRATRGTRPKIRIVVIADVASGMNARDCADVAAFFEEVSASENDEAAWRPLIRALRLIKRSELAARPWGGK